MIELVLLLSGAATRLLLAGPPLSAAVAGLFLAVLCGDDAERDASRR